MGFFDTYPKEYLAFRTTLKKASFDSANHEYMTESQIAVINFDDAKNNYMSKFIPNNDIKSVDTLAKGTDGTLYMIEFKNGSFEAPDIRSKIKDSVLILCDLCDKKLSDARNEIIFALVINSSKLKQNNSKFAMAMAKASLSRISLTKLFGLNKSEGFLVKQVWVFDKEELESKFIPQLTDI